VLENIKGSASRKLTEPLRTANPRVTRRRADSALRVALVSREVHPFGGGGIAQFVNALATLLSRTAEVTVLTTSLFESEYARRRATNDPELPPPGVHFAFVPEPSLEEHAPWYHIMHCYSARVYQRLKELYPEGGPNLIEFPDYLGEGFVTLQAAQTLDPFLASTRLCVRIHSTAEICEVLDGYAKPDFPSRAVHEFERYSLARADRVIWPGGDILGTYHRFYGRDALAPDVRIRHPYRGRIADPDKDKRFEVRDALRLLFVGRLERRKGVLNLVDAVGGLARADVSLTLVGGDTATGPLGTSVAGLVELHAAGDERVVARGPVSRGELPGLMREHDLVVLPSLWECWPYVALEALRCNRPLLASPVGGLVEIVKLGRSGWQALGTSAEDWERAVAAVLDAGPEVQALVRSGAPAGVGQELCDERQILDGYERLARAPVKRAASPIPRHGFGRPLVSAVVPYFRGARFVREAVESLLAQSYPRLEVVLVNDGSFWDEDWIVAELTARLPVVVVSQVNRGLGAARNFGISQSRGRYVFPLDCDNVAEPEFVARGVEVLEACPEMAYVTAWSRYMEEDGRLRDAPNLGYEPLGNWSRLVTEANVAGDAAAVIRRRLFDAGFSYSEELTSFEDWAFYRQLAQAGHCGAVIPERLLRYRVRADSMQAQVAQPNRVRLEGEVNALIRENQLRWTSLSA